MWAEGCEGGSPTAHHLVCILLLQLQHSAYWCHVHIVHVQCHHPLALCSAGSHVVFTGCVALGKPSQVPVVNPRK